MGLSLDVGNASPGETFRLRAKASDTHGQESDWSDWYDFTVDTTPPTITLSTDTQSALEDYLIGPDETTLSGRLSDNHLVEGVEVCTMIEGTELCRQANTLLNRNTISDTHYIYNDEPQTGMSKAHIT